MPLAAGVEAEGGKPRPVQRLQLHRRLHHGDGRDRVVPERQLPLGFRQELLPHPVRWQSGRVGDFNTNPGW